MPFSLSGLSFFTPIGLWTLLALTIPILIHLFNRSRGRLVRIGHIDLIKQARRLQVTEVKIAQWLLLLLRLGIFTLASLILAGLARPGLESSELPTAYVTPAWLRTVQPDVIVALLASGPQERIFVLQPGFMPLNRAVADEIRQTPMDVSGINNVWPLLAERLSLEHHAGAVNAYATDLLLQFGTSRPALPRLVNWDIAQPKITPLIDRLAIVVTVAYDMARKQDAEIFRAALTSIKAHRIPALTWEMVNSRQITPQQLNSDWLIHLSENILSTEQLALINTPTTVLSDAAGEPASRNLEYISLPFYPFSTFRINGLAQKSDNAQTIIATADGTPVLQEFRSGSARILHFNNRFNPQWSSITQLPEFPELLLHLMLNERQQTLAFSDARINIAQLQSGTTDQHSDIPLPRHSLQSLLAILLALLWVAERWLSERKQRAAG